MASVASSNAQPPFQEPNAASAGGGGRGEINVASPSKLTAWIIALRQRFTLKCVLLRWLATSKSRGSDRFLCS